MMFIKLFGFSLLALGWTTSVTAQYVNCTGDLSWISDGYCDLTLNNPDCQYDGGDCCECTCLDNLIYACGANGFACEDPACLDLAIVAEFRNCAGSFLRINDGECNAENNNAECGYDGGDCCICTCVANENCALNAFDCVDPSAEDQLYECQPPSSFADPCTSGVQTSWVVETSTQARAMVEAVNCSGGVFNVEWRGVVAVDKTINVVDGTTLNITGVWGSLAAVMDGGMQVRLFTVINASLHISDLGLSSGSSIVGGAIAASASNVTVIRTSFISNRANGTGGAVYVTSNSNIVFDGNATTFLNNSAIGCGGALYAFGSSVVGFNGMETYALGNAAGRNGGAIAIDQSQLWLAGKAFFANNTSGNLGGAVDVSRRSAAASIGSLFFVENKASFGGGALSVSLNSNLSWRGEATFEFNLAGIWGGAIYIDRADVSWDGTTDFTSNMAISWSGGAIYTHKSNISWSGNTAFERNKATYSGGAIYVNGADISWSGVSSFFNNSSGQGGALEIVYDSTVRWNGPSTVFAFNMATLKSGGAINTKESVLSWNGDTAFEYNRAKFTGGAIDIFGTSVSWSGVSSFLNNTSETGGALYVSLTSSLSWSDDTKFEKNRASDSGGAVYISNSNVSWDGNTEFVSNTVSGDDESRGGAMMIDSSDVSWGGVTVFFNNSALTAGAVYIKSGSNLGWIGSNTTFISNTATAWAGGAILVIQSSISWSGGTTFKYNRAKEFGGAIYATSSDVSWDGYTSSNTATDTTDSLIAPLEGELLWNYATLFLNNSATAGGALYILNGTSVRWSGPNTTFISNTATLRSGGAVVVADANVSWSGVTVFWDNFALDSGGGIMLWGGGKLDWSGDTTFAGNKANTGGALYLIQGVRVTWTGLTTFQSNEAEFEGGAIGSAPLEASLNGGLVSFLSIAGSTVFIYNTCNRDGGAMTFQGGLLVEFDPTANTTFRGNKARVAGGAIFMSSVDIGPTFDGVSFVSNSAQLGGGVYTTSSGNSKIDITGKVTFNPTIFYRCSFLGNTAIATGGAIQSAAGQDYVINSSFVGNTARAGGALYLAGTSSFFNCSFVDNVADEGAGPAISNIGYVESMLNNAFVGNAFNCVLGTYRAYSTLDNLYDVLCVDCVTLCEGCYFEYPSRVPYCEEEMTFSTSKGNSTTIEMLSIHPGYWRATATSKDIRACYHPYACRGGVTGASTYCRKGYEGPYCAICSDGYTVSLGFTCDKCSNSILGVVVITMVFAAAFFAIVLLSRYLIAGELENTQRGCLGHVIRSIPLQSVKIVIVAWQILTQFTSVANVTYPNVYQKFLDGVSVLNFDLSWILSVGCVLGLDFHDRLLFATLGPIVAMAFLGVTYGVAVLRTGRSDRDIANIRHKHLSAVLLLTFLVYSSVSSILFQTFACDKLDDGKTYLRADYRIQCDTPKHETLSAYAGFMVVLYALGIPGLYAGLLFKDRHLLANSITSGNPSAEDTRASNPRVRSISNLWKPYKPKRFYYEVIECGRRILLTGVVVFIFPNSAAQIAVTLIIAFTFAMISESLDPYASTWDTWVGRMGHVVVYVSIYTALLLKVDISGEHSESQMVFEAILVFAHTCMIAAVLGEALALVCSLRADIQEAPSPRFRRMKWIRNGR